MLLDIVDVLVTATPVPSPAPIAAAVADPSNDLAYWLAPGGGLAVFAAALLAAARMFRDGRREDVKTAREKEAEAERRADDAERERDDLVASVQQQLRDVRRDLRERDEANDLKLREMAERHATELSRMQREHLEQIRTMQAQNDIDRRRDQDRIVQLVGDNYHMQTLLESRGWNAETGKLRSGAAAREAVESAVEEGVADGTMGP